MHEPEMKRATGSHSGPAQHLHPRHGVGTLQAREGEPLRAIMVLEQPGELGRRAGAAKGFYQNLRCCRDFGIVERRN